MSTSTETRPSSKLIGLGQPPTNDLANGILQCGFTNVPVIEYVTWTTNVPILDTDLTKTFGNEIDVLQNPKSMPGIDTVDSSFIINGILQADMIAYGFGFHVFGEPMSFMQIGNVLAPAPGAAYATPVSPDVFTTNDVQAILTPAQIAAGTKLLPGIFKWGHDDWNAAWHLANAYQFNWRVYQRILLVNELAADVCYFGPYAEASAAGTSEVDVAEYARVANTRYRNLTGSAGGGASTGVFVPVNARRIGSVTASTITGATGFAGNVGVFHPTRDFDLAPTTYGGIRDQGGAACCQPFRKLPRPVLIEKGLPIGMTLNLQDEYHYTQMLRHLSISESQGGTIATVTTDTLDSGLSVAPVAATPFMPELTLDQGASTFSGQQVTTSRTLVKGGTLKLSILIKGVEVWGPWKSYIQSNMSQYFSMPGSTGTGALPPVR